MYLPKVSVQFYAQRQNQQKLYAHNRQSFLSSFVVSYEASLFTWHGCTENPILYTSRKQQYGGLSVLHGIRLYLIFVQEDIVCIASMLAFSCENRMGTPEELGFAIATLADERNGYLAGVDILCDGGTIRGMHEFKKPQ